MAHVRGCVRGGEIHVLLAWTRMLYVLACWRACVLACWRFFCVPKQLWHALRSMVAFLAAEGMVQLVLWSGCYSEPCK